MPYFGNSPEALTPRETDSNTCRGITQNGLPCKRALKSPNSSPNSSPRRGSTDGLCWQHKDQVQTTEPQPAAKLEARTSIDTLAERLGLLEIAHRRRQKTLPRDDIQARPRRKPQTRNNYGLLCCIGEANEERTSPRPASKPARTTTVTIPSPTKLTRPSFARDPSSRTGELLSLIPASTTPETTALLLAELAKPCSIHDDDGYIYMFWLTPDTLPSAPPTEAAKSLLLPPNRQTGSRRPSDAMHTFASDVKDSNQKTILLKIGRAQNVHRRLNQWTRQCGYNLSLIRYYPYQSSPVSSISVNEPPRTPRKAANVHKVERLIHIELNGKRALGHGKCGTCGKEHREWFEVEANRSGVRAVDEVVRRWVEWGERAAIR